MKKLLLGLSLAICIISCDNGDPKKYLSASSGPTNNVKVVLTKEQWQGQIGDALRTVLAAPTDGLPQEEPLFDIEQIPTSAFSGFLQKNRLFVRVKKDSIPGVVIENDVYARPQAGITIKGNNTGEISQLILDNGDKIIKALKSQELINTQNRIRKSLKKTDSLQKLMGIKLNFPTAYRYAKQEENFFWMRKDLKNGDMNITVYEVPLRTIDRDTNTIARIVRMRDSIGGKNVPVDGGRFITERAFSPYLFKTEIDGREAWETKGTWEVDGRYMAGPFLNYAIKDEKNNRYLVVEGFIFSPSQDKRDNMFEIEAILRSTRFIEAEETETAAK